MSSERNISTLGGAEAVILSQSLVFVFPMEAD